MPMAKSKKTAPKAKVKPVKAASKASKPSKPAAKATKPGLAKSLLSAVAKAVTGKKEEKKAGKPAPTLAPEKELKAKAPAKDKKLKGKKGKKAEGIDFEDDLLEADDDMGAEELPDLAEFDSEEEEVEIETADDASGDAAWAQEVKPADSDEVYLTDADGRRYCRVRDCDQASAVEGYCRFHYLLLWKKIQVRRKILQDGKLERYVDELTARYPDKFLEMIRKDLRTEKDFIGVIAELEIDESLTDSDLEDEAQSYVDEIRGMSTDSGGMSDEEEF